MNDDLGPVPMHPAGPLAPTGADAVMVDSFGGMRRVTWDVNAPMTPNGQVAFFIAFLKAAGVYEAWLAGCPLARTSPNAAAVRDVLGAVMLAVLAGNWRYAHATALRCDQVTPGLLGMARIVSEDTMRRAFIDADAEACAVWQQAHLHHTYDPLLTEPYVLDVDTTVKPLYGHQEGAVVGYNPTKPGRPSHALHTYFIAQLRLVLDVVVHPGNETAACYTHAELWRFIDGLAPASRPQFIRGDVAFGNEAMMLAAEQRGQPFLFKLRLSRKVKELVRVVSAPQTCWTDAGQGWEGVDSTLQLMGWTRARRVVVLRRPLAQPRRLKDARGRQLMLPFDAQLPDAEHYDYAVLVTSLDAPIFTLAQHYRDRGDAENNFDELKNHWGWGGFVTKDLKRTQIMARITAQVYNWWTIFTRLAVPDKHHEALTSRPLLLHAIGRQTQHGHQTTLHLTALHTQRGSVQAIMTKIARCCTLLRTCAEQLTQLQRWRYLLSLSFRWFLGHRPLTSPDPAPYPAALLALLAPAPT